MNNGVLIIAHGSRRKSTEQAFEAVVGLVREKLTDVTMETAYMEFGEKNIKDGLNCLVNAGITKISVVPYFLFDGVHINEDIPKELDEFRAEYPQIEIAMGKTLGIDSRLADILADRVREAL